MHAGCGLLQIAPAELLMRLGAALQVLLELYQQYRTAEEPTFQVYAVLGAAGASAPPAYYKATVVCPTIHRGPGDVAFETMMFEVRCEVTHRLDCE